MKKYNRRSYAGKDNPNWKGGVSPCLSCGGPLSKNNYPARGTTYCKSCYLKTLQGAGHPNWKGGIRKLPSYNAVAHAKRRARRLANGGSYSTQEWEALKARYDYMCLCCKQHEPAIKLSPDHIVPLAKGGSNDIFNIQPLCTSCNMRKNTKTIYYMPHGVGELLSV